MTRKNICWAINMRTDTTKAAASSHLGLVRESNQDAVFCSPTFLFAVADGIGGLDDGKAAANCMIRHVKSRAEKIIENCRLGSTRKVNELLRDAVSAANMELFDKAQIENKVSGTTVVIWAICGQNLCYVWSGDSSLYFVNDNKIERLTRFHTVAQEMRNRGEDDLILPRDDHTLTRYVGIGAEPEAQPESGIFDLSRYESWALFGCTDGYDVLPQDAILDQLKQSISVEEWLRQLEKMVDAAGAPDNYSAVAVVSGSQIRL